MNLDPSRMGAILSVAAASEANRKYRHWDTLRHITPPAGFSHEEWWGATKLLRSSALKDFPLRDGRQQPFRYGTPDIVSERLHKIDLGAGGLIGMPLPIATPQERNRYVMSSLFQEALTSSQLEGAATTRADAKKMIRTGRKPRTRGERMVFNNYLTMQRIAEWKTRPLDADLIFEIHRMITQDTLDAPDAAGRLRRSEEPVRVQDDITGEVFHYPPNADELPGRINLLCQWANEDTGNAERSPGKFIHPVVRAILLHFWLAYDQPIC